MSRSSSSQGKRLPLHGNYMLAAVLLATVLFIAGLIFLPEWTRANVWVFVLIIVALLAVLPFMANRRQTFDIPFTSSQNASSISTYGLRQLPTPAPDFTGREAELNELLTHARAGHGLQNLHGADGVGKTALALKLADRLKARYPDGQFYLDLQGAGDEPLSVAKALTHIVRAYHPTAQLPVSEEELREWYHSALQGQRALLLLDNAVDKWQVEPLLPPASCFLLVTSRQHLTLPGLHAKNLDALPPDDAHALLLKLAPHIKEHADEVAKRCGYLPLALRWAGSALAVNATLTPEDYTQRLTDAQTQLQPLEASLSVSYDLLDQNLQRAWCALAVFPETFDLPAAAALWDIEQEQAQDRLGELARYGVVEWDTTSAARARLHDVVRAFSATRLSGAARVDAQRRHAQHYANVIGTANELYRKGGESSMQGLALFDLEHVNIEAGQAWSAAHIAKDHEAAQTCNWYAWQGSLLGLRLHPRDNIRWLEAGLAAARRINQPEAEGAHLGNLGNAYYSQGELRRAIEYHEQALALARKIGDRRGAAASLGNLGSAYYSLGELYQAIEFHTQQRVIAREIGDQSSEANALYNMSLALDELGDRTRAVEYATAALKIREEVGDPRADKLRRQLAVWRGGS